MKNDKFKSVKKKLEDFISVRSKISILLSLLILVLYYVFIFFVGNYPDVVGYRIGPSTITLGILVGLFIIITCIITTGMYVFIANRYFDKDLREIIKDINDFDILEEFTKDEGD